MIEQTIAIRIVWICGLVLILVFVSAFVYPLDYIYFEFLSVVIVLLILNLVMAYLLYYGYLLLSQCVITDAQILEAMREGVTVAVPGNIQTRINLQGIPRPEEGFITNAVYNAPPQVIRQGITSEFRPYHSYERSLLFPGVTYNVRSNFFINADGNIARVVEP